MLTATKLILPKLLENFSRNKHSQKPTNKQNHTFYNKFILENLSQKSEWSFYFRRSAFNGTAMYHLPIFNNNFSMH